MNRDPIIPVGRVATTSLLFAGFSVELVLTPAENFAQPMHHLGKHAGVLFAIGLFDRMLVFVGVYNMNQSQIHRAILHRRRMESYASRLNPMLNLIPRGFNVGKSSANFL